MSNDPILAGLTTFFVISVALCPISGYASTVRSLFGQKEGDVPTGCSIFGLLLFLASFPLGYVMFQNFEVVWR